MHQPPAFVVQRVRHREFVIARKPRAVDRHRLEQRRAGQEVQRVREKILHQRQHAGHHRRGHARAAFVAVIRPDGVVQVAQHFKLVAEIIRRDHRLNHVEAQGLVRGRIAHGINKTAVQNARQITPAAIRRNGNVAVVFYKVVGRIVRRIRHARRRNVNWIIRRAAHRHDLQRHAHGVLRHGDKAVGQRVWRHKIADDGLVIIRAVVIFLLVPLRRARRDGEGSRRDHVWLEPSEVAFRLHAHVAARGITRHLKTAVRPRRPNGVRRAVNRRDDVRDVAQGFQRADGDDIFRRAGRADAVRHAAAAAVVAAAVIARREHEQHRLRPRVFWQRITHRRVVARRREIVGGVAAVAPTVV